MEWQASDLTILSFSLVPYSRPWESDNILLLRQPVKSGKYQGRSHGSVTFFSLVAEKKKRKSLHLTKLSGADYIVCDHPFLLLAFDHFFFYSACSHGGQGKNQRDVVDRSGRSFLKAIQNDNNNNRECLLSTSLCVE